MKNAEKELVNSFSQKMLGKLELRHDRYKPMAWKTLDIKRLIWLLEGELAELRDIHKANETGNGLIIEMTRKMNNFSIKDSAIDIANYAMFIYNL